MIEAYEQEGVSIREIGRRLGRSDKVVQNYLKDPEKYATTKRKPKKSKLSPRDKRSNLSVCKETVWKAL